MENSKRLLKGEVKKMGSLIKLGKKYFFEFSILSIILIWSSNNAVMKIGIEEIGPFIYNALRLIIVALLCWLWLYKTHTYRKMPWRDLKIFNIIGFRWILFDTSLFNFWIIKNNRR